MTTRTHSPLRALRTAALASAKHKRTIMINFSIGTNFIVFIPSFLLTRFNSQIIHLYSTKRNQFVKCLEISKNDIRFILMDLIEQLLTRGVEEVIRREHLEKRLRAGEKLRIKHGVDPTTADLHLGHAVILRKLKEFQDLGHKVVFIIGDFTAKIGDPSGRLTTRKPLAEETIKENIKTYKKQLRKILDLDKTEIIYNSKHLSKMSFAEIYRISHFFSVNQIFERDMFQQRKKMGRPVWLHEFFYPVFQAYDSVAVRADVEIGGNDQFFNMMMGRQLQPYFDQTPQDVITIKLLRGTDGVRKMSKSFGNYIGITEAPDSQYGKIMSIPDKLLPEYFVLLTDLDFDEKENSRDGKMKLAYEIVKTYHGEREAKKAEDNFIALFQKKEIPKDIEEIKVKTGDKLADILVQKNIIPSKSEFRRLVKNKAIDINGRAIEDIDYSLDKTIVVKIGKKKFIRMVI